MSILKFRSLAHIIDPHFGKLSIDCALSVFGFVIILVLLFVGCTVLALCFAGYDTTSFAYLILGMAPFFTMHTLMLGADMSFMILQRFDTMFMIGNILGATACMLIGAENIDMVFCAVMWCCCCLWAIFCDAIHPRFRGLSVKLFFSLGVVVCTAMIVCLLLGLPPVEDKAYFIFEAEMRTTAACIGFIFNMDVFLARYVYQAFRYDDCMVSICTPMRVLAMTPSDERLFRNALEKAEGIEAHGRSAAAVDIDGDPFQTHINRVRPTGDPSYAGVENGRSFNARERIPRRQVKLPSGARHSWDSFLSRDQGERYPAEEPPDGSQYSQGSIPSSSFSSMGSGSIFSSSAFNSIFNFSVSSSGADSRSGSKW